MTKFTFEPVAQNTIIRPLAQAVCIVQGGKPVRYIDTADHKEKEISYNNLYFVDIKTTINGRKTILDGRTLALWARHGKPIRLHVAINDVDVIVSKETTVEKAMAQFQEKYALQQRLERLKEAKIRAKNNVRLQRSDKQRV